MKTATCHEISEWNYSCNKQNLHIKNQQIPGSPAWNPTHDHFDFIFSTKKMKVEGGTLSSNSCGKGRWYKVCTWEPDYQRIHLTVISATTPIFLGFINWEGSHPPTHTFPQGFPKCLGFLSPSMALQSSTPLKAPHLLCQPPPSSGGGSTTLGGVGDNQTGRNHKNFYLSLFSLHG